MKKIFVSIFCLVIIAGLNFTSEAAGQTSFTLGPEISHIKYEESGIMEDKGLMYGLDGSWTYNYYNNYLFKADTRFSYGQVDYRNSGALNDIDDYILETRGVFGYKFRASEKIDIIPYIGLGYRYLNDNSAGMTSSTGAHGYERESNYLYSPIGMELTAQVIDKWSFETALEYDHFWRGWQKSHLSDANAGYNDLENTQDSGYGLRASIKALRHGKEMDFVVEPFIRYWNIKKSDEKNITYAGTIVGYGYEPKNNSTELGVLVACRWHWEQDKKQIPHLKTPAPKVRVELIPLIQERPSTADEYYNIIREKITNAVSNLTTVEKGRVAINLTLASNGEIQDICVTNKDSNISPEFRQAITQAASDSSPFPEFPPDIKKEKISLLLPIIFS